MYIYLLINIYIHICRLSRLCSPILPIFILKIHISFIDTANNIHNICLYLRKLKLVTICKLIYMCVYIY